jgi:flagellar assembly protein FliH
VHGEILYRIPLRHDERIEKLQLVADHVPTEELVVGEIDPNRELGEQILAQAEERFSQAQAAKKAAAELLAQARGGAADIRATARQGLDVEREQILAEAKSAGYAAGYREGQTQAAAEGATIRANAQEVLRQTEENRRQTLAGLEASVIDLAVEIAEKLMAAQIDLAPETVCVIAKESLRLVEDRMLVSVYINPAELPIYESKLAELKLILPPRAELQVLADPALEPCGCRIDTECGTVDATMETRRRGMLKALYGEDG